MKTHARARLGLFIHRSIDQQLLVFPVPVWLELSQLEQLPPAATVIYHNKSTQTNNTTLLMFNTM